MKSIPDYALIDCLTKSENRLEGAHYINFIKMEIRDIIGIQDYIPLSDEYFTITNFGLWFINTMEIMFTSPFND